VTLVLNKASTVNVAVSYPSSSLFFFVFVDWHRIAGFSLKLMVKVMKCHCFLAKLLLSTEQKIPSKNLQACRQFHPHNGPFPTCYHGFKPIILF
jgi:hypothetical protein